jgi:hypothetical protein
MMPGRPASTCSAVALRFRVYCSTGYGLMQFEACCRNAAQPTLATLMLYLMKLCSCIAHTQLLLAAAAACRCFGIVSLVLSSTWCLASQ